MKRWRKEKVIKVQRSAQRMDVKEDKDKDRGFAPDDPDDDVRAAPESLEQEHPVKEKEKDEEERAPRKAECEVEVASSRVNFGESIVGTVSLFLPPTPLKWIVKQLKVCVEGVESITFPSPDGAPKPPLHSSSIRFEPLSLVGPLSPLVIDESSETLFSLLISLLTSLS